MFRRYVPQSDMDVPAPPERTAREPVERPSRAREYRPPDKAGNRLRRSVTVGSTRRDQGNDQVRVGIELWLATNEEAINP